MSSTPRADLEQLLISLFNASEFRRFLVVGGHEEVVNEMPTHASPSQGVHAAVSALKERGQLDAAFFDALRAARPQRADIDGVAQAWMGSSAQPAARPAAAASKATLLAAAKGLLPSQLQELAQFELDAPVAQFSNHTQAAQAMDLINWAHLQGSDMVSKLEAGLRKRNPAAF